MNSPAEQSTDAEMERSAKRTDVLLAVQGAPHASDMTTTLMRLLDSMLRLGARVDVWTCGYATHLGQQSADDVKPRNLADLGTEYPSMGALVRGVLADWPDQLRWYVCRFCLEERGAKEPIPEVQVRSPFRFADHVGAACKTMFIGRI